MFSQLPSFGQNTSIMYTKAKLSTPHPAQNFSLVGKDVAMQALVKQPTLESARTKPSVKFKGYLDAENAVRRDIASGNIGAVEQAIKRPNSILSDPGFSKLLTFAVSKGQEKIVKLFLDNGVDPRACH